MYFNFAAMIHHLVHLVHLVHLGHLGHVQHEPTISNTNQTYINTNLHIYVYV